MGALLTLAMLGQGGALLIPTMAECRRIADEVNIGWEQAAIERAAQPMPKDPTHARVEIELRIYLGDRAKLKAKCVDLGAD